MEGVVLRRKKRVSRCGEKSALWGGADIWGGGADKYTHGLMPAELFQGDRMLELGQRLHQTSPDKATFSH